VNKRRKYILAILYIASLLCIGFIILKTVSRSKLDTQIRIFSNEKNSLESRMAALWKIAQYTDMEVTDTLVRAVQDSNPYVRIEATKLVKRRREYRAIPHLIRNLNDNTQILHQPTGTSLPMVKIVSYNALKHITGNDFGPVESQDPVEVAETLHRWELWWNANAARFGMKPSEITPDYETLITHSALSEQQRIKYFRLALQKGYPGLPDIVITLLQKEKPDSGLMFLALCSASQYKMKETVPLIISLLEKELKVKQTTQAAARINEVLVQMTGRNYGPFYRGIPAEEQNDILSRWKAFQPKG